MQNPETQFLTGVLQRDTVCPSIKTAECQQIQEWCHFFRWDRWDTCKTSTCTKFLPSERKNYDKRKKPVSHVSQTKEM